MQRPQLKTRTGRTPLAAFIGWLAANQVRDFLEPFDTFECHERAGTGIGAPGRRGITPQPDGWDDPLVRRCGTRER